MFRFFSLPLLAHFDHMPNLRLHELLERVVCRAAGRLLVPVVNQIAALQIQPQPVQAIENRHGGEQEEDGEHSVDGKFLRQSKRDASMPVTLEKLNMLPHLFGR